MTKTPIANLDDFAALDPFFRIVERGLDGLVDPGHFFDLMAEDVLTEYVVTVPGYPRLDRAFDLAVYYDATQNVAVLEYAVEGRTVHGNRRYANHFISVITIENREIVRWRDYLDPVAVFNALGWPQS